MNRVFKIYVDFDGTIARQDVGEEFVYRFGDREKIKAILDDWIAKKINSRESWIRMFETFSGLTEAAFEQMLSKIETDPSFADFITYCRQSGFEVRILSDGFDLYIRRILASIGLADLTVLSNSAVINDDGSLGLKFPYGDEDCRLCANCKRNHILTTSGDEEFTVYIGDGYSDRCPVEFCDFIFAKKDLLRHCEMNRISFFHFSDFHDVSKRLKELASRKRLKKRHQADLKRMEVYKTG